MVVAEIPWGMPQFGKSLRNLARSYAQVFGEERGCRGGCDSGGECGCGRKRAVAGCGQEDIRGQACDCGTSSLNSGGERESSPSCPCNRNQTKSTTDSWSSGPPKLCGCDQCNVIKEQIKREMKAMAPNMLDIVRYPDWRRILGARVLSVYRRLLAEQNWKNRLRGN
jgi:hypothetical protein